jgi:hypoxanthine phosphoribosyltransferase
MRILYSREEIEEVVRVLATRIEEDFAGEEVLFVCLLKGSFVFTADLLRHVTLPARVDFIRVSSYGDGMSTSGKVVISKDLEEDIGGRNVVIVEDIIDTGLTLKYIKELLAGRNPKALKVCALVDKRERREVEFEGDYVGFTLDDGFIVGYGIDYAELYRNLPQIYVVEKE